MSKMVKVRYIGPKGSREVTLEEARKILEATYDDPLGGMVVDSKTGQTIWQIDENVDEIMVIEHMLGGG